MNQRLVVIISDSEQDIVNTNTNVRNIGRTTVPIYRKTVSDVIRGLTEKEKAGTLSTTTNALFVLDLKIGDHPLGGEEILKNLRRKGYRSPVLIRSNYIAGITNEASAITRLISEGLFDLHKYLLIQRERKNLTLCRRESLDCAYP